MEEVTKEVFSSRLYVLSMLGSEENVKNLKKQLNFHDSNVFYGLNFKNMFHNVNPFDNPMVPFETKAYITFKPGSVACLLNHYYAIYDAFKRDLDYAFFIEDDVCLIEPLESLNEAIKELPENFDCLNFGWIPSIVKSERGITPQEYSKSLYKNNGMEQSGAFGYMLSRSGMERVINILKNNFIVSDLMFKYLHTYYMKRPLLEHQPAFVESRIR